MSLDRRKLDEVAFLLALAAIAASGLAFVVKANGAAVVMCGIVFAGRVAGRVAGVSGLGLLVLSVGLVVILGVAWVTPLSTPERTSAFAHFWGGFLVASALAVTLRRRAPWPRWGWLVFGTVVAITVGWEICEYVADRILDTALIPDWRDSADDIRFGVFAGAIAIGLVRMYDRRRPAD